MTIRKKDKINFLMSLNIIKKAFQDSCRYASVTDAFIDCTSANAFIYSTWTQKGPTKKYDFTKIYRMNNFSLKHVKDFLCDDVTTMPIIGGGEGISSPTYFVNEGGYTYKRRIYIRRCAESEVTAPPSAVNEVDTKCHDFLEVWDEKGLRNSYDLGEMDVHGKVYLDSTFGGIAVSADANRVAYIAERKKAKPNSFFQKYEDSDEVGQEYRYVEDWGEQMMGKSQGEVVVFDLVSETCSIVTSFPEGWSPGQLIWKRNVLIGIAVCSTPRHLGIIYCSNRLSVVFSISEFGEYKVLSQTDGIACTSPRVFTAPDMEKDFVVWLQRALDPCNYPGPHRSCYRLMKFQSGHLSCLVDIVNEYIQATDDMYLSIACQSLPKRPFSSNGTLMFFSNPAAGHIDTEEVVAVSCCEEGKYFHVSNSHHVMVLDVLNNFILGVHSNPICPQRLCVAKFEGNTDMNFEFLERNTPIPEADDWIFRPMVIENPLPHPNAKFHGVKPSFIYVGPKGGSIKGSVPLIVFPHGGPHSIMTTGFSCEVQFFLRLGYGVCLVNYRGSLGVGQDGVESLLGHVGHIDVYDCDLARDLCLKEFPHLDPDSVLLCGGSHGGFLVTHLVGQFPNNYRGVVARNPVINIATMTATSDIPDWTFNETGYNYAYQPPNPALYESMFLKSPISHVAKVQVPVLLMVGSLDLRVPASQSFEYYHALKTLGKDVEANVYSDCHPLSKPKIYANELINSAIFFQRCLKHPKMP